MTKTHPLIERIAQQQQQQEIDSVIAVARKQIGSLRDELEYLDAIMDLLSNLNHATITLKRFETKLEVLQRYFGKKSP